MPHLRCLPVGLVAVELGDQRCVGVGGGEPPAVVELGGDRLPHRQGLPVAFVGGQVEAWYEPVPGYRLHHSLGKPTAVRPGPAARLVVLRHWGDSGVGLSRGSPESV